MVFSLLCSDGANALGAVTYRALQRRETLIICFITYNRRCCRSCNICCFRGVAPYKIPVHVKKHFGALTYSSDHAYKYCPKLVKIQLRFIKIKAVQFFCQFLVYLLYTLFRQQVCYCFTWKYLSFFWTLKSGWSHIPRLLLWFVILQTLLLSFSFSL